MTNAQDFSVIVGALLPPVMAVILQEHWSSTVKSWVAFVCCVIAALATTYFAGTLKVGSGHQVEVVGTNVALVAAAAWALYHGFWKSSGVAPAIESKTNLPHFGIIPDAPAPPAAPPAAQP